MSTFTQCEYSLQTVNHVRNCPTDAVSWNKAAERMDCQSIEHNCSSGLNSQRYVFQYHCVVNGWLNSTLEVCAFNRTIFGKFGIKITQFLMNYKLKSNSHNRKIQIICIMTPFPPTTPSTNQTIMNKLKSISVKCTLSFLICTRFAYKMFFIRKNNL